MPTSMPTPNPSHGARPARANMNLIMMPEIPDIQRPKFCEGPHEAPPVAATRMAWRNGNEYRPSRYIGLCEEHARREPCARCGCGGSLKDKRGRCQDQTECEGRPERRNRGWY